MAVRLWFDMAEVRAVTEDEYAMHRSLIRTFRLTWRNFRPLFWIYSRLSLLALLGSALALWVGIELVPHQDVGTVFLLTQAVIFLWILSRLWQRSSEILWYQGYASGVSPFAEASSFADESPMEPPPAPEAPPAEVSL